MRTLLEIDTEIDAINQEVSRDVRIPLSELMPLLNRLDTLRVERVAVWEFDRMGAPGAAFAAPYKK